MKDTELYPSFRRFGWKAYEEGRLEAATKVAHYFLAWNEDDADAHQLLGLVCHAATDYDESVAELETASSISPLKLCAEVCLAHGYTRTGHISLACDLLWELAGRKGVPAPLRIQIAAGLDLVDRPDMALKTVHSLVLEESESEIADAWYDLGYYIGRCGGYDYEVEEATRRAIELDSQNSRYRVGLAGLLYRHDRMEEAIDLIRSFTEEAITEINCICCLKKVVELYRRADDGFRTLTAIAHLKKLHQQSSA